MELDSQFAFPNAPEQFQDEIVKEFFLDALPLVIREKLLPSTSSYSSATALAVAAEETRSYLRRYNLLNGKVAEIGQVNVQSQPNNQTNNSKSWKNQSNNNNTSNSNNINSTSGIKRPTNEQRAAMKDKTCFKCGTQGHTVNWCRVPKHKWKTAQNNTTFRIGNNHNQNTSVNRVMSADDIDQFAVRAVHLLKQQQQNTD